MTFRQLNRIALPLAAASFLLAACGGAAVAPSATPVPTAVATTSTTATAATSATTASTVTTGTWTVSDTSKATVRVREQLVGVNLPSDAVLVATGATGTFVLKDDGTFSADSKLTFDLTTLASDQRDRDNFVKMDTLQTRQFPMADFVPTKTSGLTLPMPASGEFTFKLTGQITIHGKTKRERAHGDRNSGADLEVRRLRDVCTVRALPCRERRRRDPRRRRPRRDLEGAELKEA